MKVLITGGAGFIGSALVNYLHSRHFEVSIIDNFSFGKRSFVNLPASDIFEGDILDQQFLESAFQKINPNWVIHLAAIHFIPYCNDHPFESAKINIVGTKNVLDISAKTSSVSKILFASTAAVYPPSSVAHHEDDPVGPMDIYGLSKLTGEYLCNEFFLKTAIPTIICRFFNAFGPNETNDHLIPAIQSQLNAGQHHLKLGNLDPKRDFIHTLDMAKAVLLLSERFSSGIDIFNLGRGIEYSVTDIVRAFEQELGLPITYESDPQRVRKVERTNLLANINKIENLTGWRPVISINEGIRTLLKT